MNYSHIDQMKMGWFVGAFEPTAYSTDVCEVALKTYKAGQREAEHYHRVATEITLVVSGRVRMAGRELGPGDIVIISPGERTDFEAITDAVNVVVKTPGTLGDKYLTSNS